jgi:hypothetical protein
MSPFKEFVFPMPQEAAVVFLHGAGYFFLICLISLGLVLHGHEQFLGVGCIAAFLAAAEVGVYWLTRIKIKST